MNTHKSIAGSSFSKELGKHTIETNVVQIIYDLNNWIWIYKD